MEAKSNQVVAFTGHRKERILQGCGNNPQVLARIKEMVVELVTELYGQGCTVYYTGMANGFDMIAAEAVLKVREEYEDIMLMAAVPFRKQPLWFDAEDQLL
ncbi:SLOG family protein [Bacteroides acidifaciens]|uniref:SLOG family protein n=1 Tax=Bacteroides acidifaciens TaxID=85831 RepID=UPI002594F1BC|nr:SLOG family protein [Bacteroides acidifaciens]